MGKAIALLWESNRRETTGRRAGLRIPVWRVWYPDREPHLGRPCKDEASARRKADIWNAGQALARGGPTEERSETLVCADNNL